MEEMDEYNESEEDDYEPREPTLEEYQLMEEQWWEDIKELNEEIQQESEPVKEDVIKKIKESFFSMFRMVNPNNKFEPAMIASFYSIIGEGLIKNPIQIKLANIDMRFNFGVCVPSGFGKQPISEVVKVTAKHINKKCIDFTSVHEEQLVGKKWKDKKEGIQEVKGYFNEDFIMKDDALPFLNHKDYEISRNYFLRALDVYGLNEIYKRTVESKEALEYLANCTFIYFLQSEKKVNIENISTGLWRRAPILRIDLNKAEKKEILNKRVSEDYIPYPELWYNTLQKFSNLVILYKPIKKELVDKISNKAVSYMYDIPLLSSLHIVNQNNIIKFAYIIRLLKISKFLNNSSEIQKIELEIEEDDVDEAIKDYEIIFEAIKRFVEGNGCNFNKIEQKILEILRVRDCYSVETSNISAKELEEKATKELGENQANVHNYLYILKKEGVIEISKEGQYSSKVWIK